MQITVLGMHRSGTSIVARLLNLMGAYFAPEGQGMSVQADNPKGFWERTDVQELNDEILTAADASWDSVGRFALEKIDRDRKTLLASKIGDVLRTLDSHRPWMLKDPRMCLTLPLWRPHLEVPVCVHVYRNPIQVAQSLARRNQFPLHYGIALWEAYTISSLNASKGLPRILVSQQEVLKDPISSVRSLYERLGSHGVVGLRMPAETEIRSYIDHSLYHETGGKALFPDYLNFNQAKLVDAFEDCSIPR